MKFCLGTVQFGMKYGINNQKRPDVNESLIILDYAVHNGINAIDTARAYGDAENITGKFIRKKSISRKELFISTKLMPNILDDIPAEKYQDKILSELKEQLDTLGTDYVDVYLLHSSRYAKNPAILDALKVIKKEGLARNVGVSVYEPDEALSCMGHPGMDFMQLPYSVFDHRMSDNGIFETAGNKSFCVASRSAFIQGLITMNENEVPSYLRKAVPILRKLDKLSKNTGLSRIELAIGYVKRQKAISYLVFGVDNIDQLKENIEVFGKDMDDEICRLIDNEFAGIEADIVMPSLWKKD